jgi:uncharacterized protein (TIGR02391 family)
MISSLADAVLESASKTLGEAVTGTVLDEMFMAQHVLDVSEASTKWRRIYRTFLARQQQDKCANKFGAFIEGVASPGRWTGRRDEFARFRDELNEALLLGGLQLGPDGKLKAVTAAKTVDESAARANRLRAKLRDRGVHNDVLRFSERLLIRDDNYFHAVFEVTKSVMDRLRTMSGSAEDGNRLINDTLECGSRPFPIVALNRYDTPSLQNEQKGIAHLARGLVHAFRNVTAHEPQVVWHISEEDALDMMSIASLILRRLDGATVTTAYQPVP